MSDNVNQIAGFVHRHCMQCVFCSTRHGWRTVQCRLPVRHCREDNASRLRVVAIHHCSWPMPKWQILSPWRLLSNVLAWQSNHSKNCVNWERQLFNKVILNPSHVLRRHLLPKSVASSDYNLGPRTRDRQISRRQAHISDCNLINCMFCDSH